MIRFRDSDVSTIDAHNSVLKNKGAVLWGLWLKSFENKDEILEELRAGSAYLNSAISGVSA